MGEGLSQNVGRITVYMFVTLYKDTNFTKKLEWHPEQNTQIEE